MKNIIMFVVYSVLVFGAGVKYHQYYTGYTENIARDVKDIVTKSHNDIQNTNAKNLVEIQSLLKDNEIKVVEIEVPKIVEKEIYKNVCFDQDGVDILSKYKIESSKIIKGNKQ